MPMKDPKDFATGDTAKEFCCYCSNDDGTLKTYEQILDGSIQFAMQEFGMTRQVAEIETPKYLKTLPAWRD